ncbi:hypothetical protein [Dietzia sp. PP-33]|jgi:hypothetical protein|uniref:hypothetical protein n=1 Tax=Dietzia sp. PP-33 TaxID=2957500 RepID=UPI0029AB1FE5|nr:hypothetical protein [Dietzia sp. PP-33]MDX2357060.1 hypothetical protein [Dietzia sp. PP-33]
MTTENPTTGPVDRTEAARLLAEAEGRPPVSSTRDARVFAWFAAVIAVVMGLGTIAVMFSDWAMVPYVLLLFAVIFWQRRAISASPRGSGRTYLWGVAGSGVMVLVVVTGLHVIRTTIGLTPWWYLLGVVLVAVPGLVAAARIARRGTVRRGTVRRGDER